MDVTSHRVVVLQVSAAPAREVPHISICVLARHLVSWPRLARQFCCIHRVTSEPLLTVSASSRQYREGWGCQAEVRKSTIPTGAGKGRRWVAHVHTLRVPKEEGSRAWQNQNRGKGVAWMYTIDVRPQTPEPFPLWAEPGSTSVKWLGMQTWTSE